jgi:xylulokinase
MFASALDRPVLLVAGAATGPAVGAARLARIAVTGEPVAAVCAKPATVDRILPDPRRRDALAARHPEFRALYEALRPRFRAAAG